MKFSLRKWSNVLILAAQVIILVFLTLLCVIPFSCKVSEEGIRIVGGDYTSPVLEELNVLDERTVQISFSEKVKIKSYTVSERLTDISDSYEHSDTTELSPALKAASGGYGRVESDCMLSEDGCLVTFSAADKYTVGKAYEIFGVVEDKAGNTLTFCVPFNGFNSRVPELVMTEVQPKYKKYKEEYRFEYVEFLALTDGNLSGLELVSAADGQAKKYEFPPDNVTSGEVFVLHLRNACSGAVNESDNLNEATAYHSAKNVRDIWAENDKSRLGDSSDVIVIRNSVDGRILDALMYVTEDAVEWGKGLSAFAAEAAEYGIYENASVDDAETNSGLGSSAQNSFSRNDASSLQEKARRGAFTSGQESYPVRRSAETWTIKKANPGSL